MNEIEDEVVPNLKDIDGYLNIGRETSTNRREIFFTCKDFRKPAKAADQLIKKYSGTLDISFEIYKDKYWRTFRAYEPR